MANVFTTTASSVATDTLTTVARVREYLGLTSSDDDAQLSHLLLAGSRAIEKYCDRLFISAARTEYIRPRAGQFLTVSAYPITAVSAVAVRRDAVTFYNTSATNERATVGYDGTSITLTRYASGVSSTNLFTLSLGYATFDALVTQTVAAGNGWTASVLNGYGLWKPTTLGPNQGTKDAKNGATLYVYDETQVCDFDWDANTSTVEGRFGCEQWVKVAYTGGYATIPDDVQAACAALVGSMYRITSSDNTLKREKLGQYEYELADPATLAAGIPSLSPDAAFLLQSYKRPRL